MRRKILVLALTAAQLAVFGALIVHQVVDWNRTGWLGFAYAAAPGSDHRPEALRSMSDLGAAPGGVAVVAPASPAARSGVRIGDTVVAIDGAPITDVDRLRELTSEVGTGDELDYEFKRDDEQLRLTLRLDSPFRSPYVVATTASTVLVGMVFLVISLLVYWGRPESRQALVFFLMSATGAAVYLVWAIAELAWPDLRGVLPLGVDLGLFVYLGIAFVLSVVLANQLLHLALVFPKERPVVGRWPQVFVWLHVVPFLFPIGVVGLGGGLTVTRTVAGAIAFEATVAALAVGLVLRLVRATRREGLRTAVGARPWTSFALILVLLCQLGVALRLLVPAGLVPLVAGLVGAGSVLQLVAFMVAYSILTCIALYRSYRESGVDVKHQVRWPLWGTLTALGGTVLLTVLGLVLAIVAPSFGTTHYPISLLVGVVSKALYLLIPLSFAFAIVKYRLLDIDVIIRKTVVYSGVTGFILAVYLLLAGLSGLALARSVGFESQTATVVATLAVVAMFVPVRSRIQDFVDRRFFRRERSYAEASLRISESVRHATNLDDLLPDLAEELQQTVQCRSVAILVRPRGGDRLTLETSVGLSDRGATGLAIRSSSALLAGDPVVVVDGVELPADEQQVLRRADAAVVAVAHGTEQPVGLLTFGRKLDRTPYDDEDVTFLRAAADQLEIAVGRLQQRRAEVEFEQARVIQRALLPAEIPTLPGVDVAARWRPAREVGGDYYDVLRLADDRLALCIGDVVGKGMPAALLMSSLQAAVKAVAAAGDSARTVCEQVRAVIRSNLTGGKFITFFYGVVDRGSQRLRYANAGHNPPILLRADGTLVRLDVGGPAMARLLADLPYQEAEIPIRPGDRLVLFTDGASEAMSAAGELLGERRIEEVIRANASRPADELLEALSDAALEFADGELQDDLTLVVAAIG